MKKIELLCVGKIKEEWINSGIKEYAKRLSRFCSFSIKELADYPDAMDGQSKESLSIIGNMGGYSILTDIKGDNMTSEQFAAVIDKAFLSNDKVQIIIGGSHGVNEQVRAKSRSKVSFGKMTYPHRLMRLIAVEQIYRAMTITAGLPYHK